MSRSSATRWMGFRSGDPGPRLTWLRQHATEATKRGPAPHAPHSRPLSTNAERERGGVWGGRIAGPPSPQDHSARRARAVLFLRRLRPARSPSRSAAICVPGRPQAQPICGPSRRSARRPRASSVHNVSRTSEVSDGRLFGQRTDMDILWTSTRGLRDAFSRLLRGGHVRTVTGAREMCPLSHSYRSVRALSWECARAAARGVLSRGLTRPRGPGILM